MPPVIYACAMAADGPTRAEAEAPPFGHTIVGVLGMIGVGKTTVLEGAAAARAIPVFKEYVVGPMLDDYIHRRAGVTAFVFQLAMMQAACVRLDNAVALAVALHRREDAAAGAAATEPLGEAQARRALVASGAVAERLAANVAADRVILHERPPHENRVFALANRLVGQLAPDEYATYLRYVDAMLARVDEAGVPQHNVLLWAPPAHTHANMLRRGIASEADYDAAGYLDCLHHCYFLELLRMLAAAGTRPHRLAPAVLDWREYGDYARMVRGLLHAQRDPCALAWADATPVLSAEDGQRGVFAVDLDAYMRADAAQRGRLRVAALAALAVHVASDTDDGLTWRPARHVTIAGAADIGALYAPDGRFARDTLYAGPAAGPAAAPAAASAAAAGPSALPLLVALGAAALAPVQPLFGVLAVVLVFLQLLQMDPPNT